MRKLMCVLGLLVGSCTTLPEPAVPDECPSNYRFHAMHSGAVDLIVLDEELLLPVELAADAFRSAFPYEIRVSFDPLARPRDRGTVFFVEPYSNLGTTHLWTHTGDFYVTINSNLLLSDEDVLQFVVSHEVGHVLGLHHARCEQSVMNSYGYHLFPTERDLKELRNAY